MLNQFKSDKKGELGEYIIADYQETGYDLVVLATTFPGKPEVYKPGDKDVVWGGGAGDWQVDYQIVSNTFWALVKKYEPVAIMTTSRSDNTKKWILEIGSTNLKRSGWYTGFDWNTGRPPYIAGSADDPAPPNKGKTPEMDGPPDATNATGGTREIPKIEPRNVKALQITIRDALKKAIKAEDLAPEQNEAVEGGEGDNYVSAFTCYHAVWYQSWKPDSCQAGWHTHVGFNIDLAIAKKAIKLQLDELIKWLK